MSVVQNSINANSTTPLPVSRGGTGDNTLTSNGILYGNGTSAIQATSALTNGQILIGSTGVAPVPAFITAGTNISISNTAGGITISDITYAAQNNIIIGGDFGTNPWRRGTTFNSAAAGKYTAERFAWTNSGTGVINITKTADAPTQAQANYFSTNCLAATVATADTSIAAGDFYLLYYKVEGYDFAPLAQQQFTLSFWVKSSVTGIYTIGFQNGGGDRSYTTEYTISSANTWEYHSVTVAASPSAGTWDYTNGTGLVIYINLAVGSTYATTAGSWVTGNFFTTSNQVNAMATNGNSFRIDLVKLEVGPNPTQFVARRFNDELTLCNRYYFKSYDLTTVPGTATTTGMTLTESGITVTNGSAISTDRVNYMRAAPTVTYYSPVTGTSGKAFDYFAVGDFSVGSVYVGQNASTITNNSGGSLTTPAAGYHFTFDAEL